MTEDAYLQEFSPEDCVDSTLARADREFFCVLKMHTVLIIDDVCYSRTRNCNCKQCIYDEEGLILTRLVWVLLDMMEDKK